VIGIGTLLNVSGIVIGGIAGLAKKTPLSAANQSFLKVALGAFTAFCGLRLTWISLNLNGTVLQTLKQLGIVLLALVAGRLVGRLLRLQKTSNRLGQFARERIAAAKPDNPDRFNEGFRVCAVLFCAAPLGILGAIHDGLSGYISPLALKGVMDGLAAMGFVSIFGWGVVLSAVPLLVFQGTLTLLCARFLLPWLQAHNLVDPLNATGGLLIFCVALIIFEIRKIELTDYLPSLCFAPLFAWWLR
jgi:uncharacterized membrane protein YqgA involved in biofilm formation